MSRYGIRMLSNFLTTPVFNKPTPPDVNKRGDNLEAYEVKVSDTGEHSYIVRKKEIQLLENTTR
jgi:hypothetical protein